MITIIFILLKIFAAFMLTVSWWWVVLAVIIDIILLSGAVGDGLWLVGDFIDIID
jgi:hypothetical protein